MSLPDGSKPGEDAGRLGPALLVALLVVSLAAGILVYRARTPDLALEVTKITRNIDLGEGDRARFTFFVRFDDPGATVSIVGRNKEPVRTLYEGELAEGVRVTCTWAGTDDADDVAPVGRYRLRVELPSEDRDMVYPRRIDIVGAPLEFPAKQAVAEPAEACEVQS